MRRPGELGLAVEQGAAVVLRASAFLAVATKDNCSAGFAGFDEETGVGSTWTR